MPEAEILEDAQGEQEFAAQVSVFRRRRVLTWVGMLALLGAIAAVFLWPVPACEQLAQEVCQKAYLHCGRSREAIKGSLERKQCEALLTQLHDDDVGEALRDLMEMFPGIEYTEAELEMMKKHPKRVF